MFFINREGMELPSFVLVLLAVALAAVTIFGRLLRINTRAAGTGGDTLDRIPVIPTQ